MVGRTTKLCESGVGGHQESWIKIGVSATKSRGQRWEGGDKGSWIKVGDRPPRVVNKDGWGLPRVVDKDGCGPPRVVDGGGREATNSRG